MHRIAFGDWRPGTHNLALAVIQVTAVVQAGIRGMDYVQQRPVPVSPILRSATEVGNLPIWGAVFLLGAGLLVAGLSGGWVEPIFAGHGVLTAVYFVLGCLMISDVPIRDGLVAVGAGAGFVVGMWLVLTRWESRNAVRFWLSLVLTFGCGYLAAYGLGYDFRTATAVVSASVIQCALLAGTAVLVYRDRNPRSAA